MSTQGYGNTYRAALDQALTDLGLVFQEFERLQARKERLEDLLAALDPFLAREEAPFDEIRQPASASPIEMQPAYDPALNAVAMAAPAVPDPVVAAAYDPIHDVIQDPIQRRINRALGLAVA